MRLVSWNCQAGFDKKTHVVDRLNPDVLVLQECNEVNVLSQRSDVSHLWRTPGNPGSKGFGIYAMNGWTVRPIASPSDDPWLIPCEIFTPKGTEWARLLGMWTNVQKGVDRPNYAGQFAQSLETWRHEIEKVPTLIAGDLNASLQGPSKAPHQQNIITAESLGLRSAYHHFNNIDHGNEQDMTLKWVGPGKVTYYYHCDFVFIPPALQSNGTCNIDPIFTSSEKHISDHQPVVVDLLA